MLTVSCRSRWTVLSLVFLFCFGLCLPSGAAYSGAVPKNLQVMDLPAAPNDAEMRKARASFHAGNSIIRMAGVQIGDALRMLQLQLPDVEATTARSKHSIPMNAASGGETLKLKALAAYIDGNGTVRSVETFAPEIGDESKWRALLEKWTTQELSRAAGAQAGDPAPPEGAWTTLYVTTVQASADGGAEEDNVSVYRLNTQDATTDTYLVYTIPTVQPNWHGNCDGIEECDWHTYSRLLGTGLTPKGLVTDHGPTGTINTSTANFSIGVSSDPSATFG